MQRGNSASSYARNSSTQGAAFAAILPALRDAISCSLRIEIGGDGLVRVADLGCGSGDNSISAVHAVVEEIRSKLGGDVEFEALFSDVASNDFNNLFTLMCSRNGNGDVFGAGVPGSFYNRLFPRSSIHFAMSNVALHWLSKVPDEVLDENSESWNGGRISSDVSTPAVRNAYARQAHRDFCQFLSCRAQEIVPGGLLSLFMNGVSDDLREGEREFVQWHTSCLQLAFDELVAENLMDKTVLDTFNIPSFSRSTNELVQAVEEADNKFGILHMEVIPFEMPSYARASAAAGLKLDPVDYARKEALITISVMKPLISAHLKNTALVDQLFKRFEAKLVHNRDRLFAPMVFAILQRKN